MLSVVVCCLLFVFVCCSWSSLFVACLVVLCDDVVYRLFVVGIVSLYCLWGVGVVVVRRLSLFVVVVVVVGVCYGSRLLLRLCVSCVLVLLVGWCLLFVACLLELLVLVVIVGCVVVVVCHCLL